MEYMREPYLPQEIDNITLAFPASVSHLMPSYEDIPDEFRTFNFDRTARKGPDLWLQFQNTWFFRGLGKDSAFIPKDGIDPEKALRHLSAIQGSFEPKHEHKAAAVAYLASLWFEDWTPGSE